MKHEVSDATVRAFRQTVNMPPARHRRWLSTDQSTLVALTTEEDEESLPVHSARRIAALLMKKRSELTDEDFQHMRRVVGVVRQRLAQRPHGDVRDTPWRWSLMNWGHDPLAD